jgi:hypothetical protein
MEDGRNGSGAVLVPSKRTDGTTYHVRLDGRTAATGCCRLRR